MAKFFFGLAFCGALSLYTVETLAQNTLPSQPDDFDPCKTGTLSAWNKIAPDFVDFWSAHHKAGVARSSQGILPFPADPQIVNLELVQVGTDLVALHPDLAFDLVFEWVDEPRWRFNDVTDGKRVFSPEFNEEELALVLGCDLMNAPRLRAQATVTYNGTPMEMTYRLTVVNRDTLYGVFQVHTSPRGQATTIARPVIFSRM